MGVKEDLMVAGQQSGLGVTDPHAGAFLDDVAAYLGHPVGHRILVADAMYWLLVDRDAETHSVEHESKVVGEFVDQLVGVQMDLHDLGDAFEDGVDEVGDLPVDWEKLTTMCTVGGAHSGDRHSQEEFLLDREGG